MARHIGKPRARFALVGSVLALGVAQLWSEAAAAQSTGFNSGDPRVASGSVTFSRGTTAANTDVYTVATPTAVLDFVPSDTRGASGSVINFENAGATAIFQSTPGGPAFTVLNRITPNDPSRPIQFNGNVISQLRDTQNNASRGGTVWFYSPGGIVVGGQAVFDVGSLLLTTGDPTGGTGQIASTTSFQMASTPDRGAAVNVLSGATLRASAPGSYIALVAPVVFQAGTVDVNGSAAYVAAETARLNFSGGLFSINVGVGSSAANGMPLQIRGSTTGPASSGVGDPRAIYAVAVPKNDAITMIVAPTGNFGFAPATSATSQNGTIILQAGGSPTLSTAPAGITMADLSTTASLTATASGTISAGSISAGRIMLGSSAGNISAGDLTATRDVIAASDGGGLTTGNVESTGGSVSLLANGALAASNIRAAGPIDIVARGPITTGDLTAGTGPLLDGSGTATGGSGSSAGVTGGIASGFDSGQLQRCDDCFTEEPAQLPFAVNFFGNSYGQTYVSSNGYITFGEGDASFTPTGLGQGYSGLPIIAAFFADVDTSNSASGTITYGNGNYAGHTAFGATWNSVGYFSSHADKLNSFQILLTDRSDTGSGNFDIYFNYGHIGWETGDADNGTNGLGGTSAAVGFNAGSGNQSGTFFELPGSRVPGSFIDNGTMPLTTVSNDGVPGQLLFNVRNGSVQAPSAGPATITISNLGAPAGTAADISTGALSAEAIDIRGSGNVLTGNITAALRSGSQTSAALGTLIEANGDLHAGDINSAQTIGLRAEQGNIATGAITTTSSAVLLAGGGVSIGAVTTGQQDQSLFISNASVLDNNAAFAGSGFTGAASGSSFDPATLASVAPIATGGSISFGGPVTTGHLVAASSQNMILSGPVGAGTINLASADVDIGGNASLGGSGTSSIQLQILGGAPATIGGTGNGSGYTLDAAEFSQLHATDISISQQGLASGSPQLVVRDLAISGAEASTGANLTGSDGTLSISTPGSISVAGNVRMTGASASNGLLFDAGTSFSLNTGEGSIGLFGAGTSLGGRLSISANGIAVADGELLGRIGQGGITSENFADIKTALGTPPAAARPEGFVQAGALDLTATDYVAIQNSGTSSLAAGFTAGSGGMRITSRSQATQGDGLKVAIYGRTTGTDGTFQTNSATRRGIELVSAGQSEQGSDPLAGFSPQSVVNGCALNPSLACSSPAAVLSLDTNILAISRAAEPRRDDAFAVPAIRLATLIDESTLRKSAIVTDPVASAGNASFWDTTADISDGPASDDDQARRKKRSSKSGERPR